MAANTYQEAIAKVFLDEGGYTNHPSDPGGPTNWGITINDARAYWKSNATASDVKAMPKVVAEQIYRTKYAAPIRYDQLPAGFDYTVLDFGINSGIGRAIPYAAAVLGAKAGTKIDTIVPLAAIHPDKVKLIQSYWAKRLSFLKSLKTWATFGKGWGRRVSTGEALAVKLWLKYGAKLQPDAVNSELKKQAESAATSSKTNKATAGGAVVSTSPSASFDWSHISMGGKVAIALVGAALIGLAIYFIHKAIINSQRATAYANAAEA